MKRISILLGAGCLLCALTLVGGCGGQGSGGGQPKLANPNDPKVKDLAPVQVGGPPAKGAGGKANPF